MKSIHGEHNTSPHKCERCGKKTKDRTRWSWWNADDGIGWEGLFVCASCFKKGD